MVIAGKSFAGDVREHATNYATQRVAYQEVVADVIGGHEKTRAGMGRFG
jgi:hypothetical protein